MNTIDLNKQDKMDLRCKDCSNLFHIDVDFPMDIMSFSKKMKKIECPECKSKKILMGQGRSIAEDLKFRTTTLHDSVEDRVRDWLKNGEIGTSSKTIISVLLNINYSDMNHPKDISDLKRCLLLLDRIPEFENRILEMSDLSIEWKRLSHNWNKLKDNLIQDGEFISDKEKYENIKNFF